MYIIRLDDACECWNRENWLRVAEILKNYEIYPIFGIIPKNLDKNLLKYGCDNEFLETVKEWINQGWEPALHSYNHIYNTTDAKGLNPIHRWSEFAGLDLKEQRIKIREGNKVLLSNGINAKIFFPLAHTFDKNTLKALKKETNIRIISDTIATDLYFENDFYFIPQQAGQVRKLPFKVVTFCYHPNDMLDSDFDKLEKFIQKNKQHFTQASKIKLVKRKKNIIDILLNKMYLLKCKFRD